MGRTLLSDVLSATRKLSQRSLSRAVGVSGLWIMVDAPCVNEVSARMAHTVVVPRLHAYTVARLFELSSSGLSTCLKSPLSRSCLWWRCPRLRTSHRNRHSSPVPVRNPASLKTWYTQIGSSTTRVCLTALDT